MFALATLMSASVFAQDNDAKRLPGYKTTFEGNGFWNNWFMSANFGAQSLFAENSKDAKFRNTITFMPTLSGEFVYKVQAAHCTDLLLVLTQCYTINMVLFTQTLCSD